MNINSSESADGVFLVLIIRKWESVEEAELPSAYTILVAGSVSKRNVTIGSRETK